MVMRLTLQASRTAISSMLTEPAVISASHFFEFLGILSVALPHDQVVALFVGPMTRFKDEPFYDAAATYLPGFDRAVRATDTKKPEDPVGIRTLLANRVRREETSGAMSARKRSTARDMPGRR